MLLPWAVHILDSIGLLCMIFKVCCAIDFAGIGIIQDTIADMQILCIRNVFRYAIIIICGWITVDSFHSADI